MRVIIYLILAYFISSCEYIDSLTANGDIISTEFDHGTVKNIIIEAPCRINLKSDTLSRTEIVGYDYHIQDLEITYKNDSLIIDHKKKEYLQRSKIIELSVPSGNIEKITANRTAQIYTSETLTCDKLQVIINGGGAFSESDIDINCENFVFRVYGRNNIGNFNISGQAHKTDFTLEGITNIDATDLIPGQAYIIHKSVGSCLLTAKDF